MKSQKKKYSKERDSVCVCVCMCVCVCICGGKCAQRENCQQKKSNRQENKICQICQQRFFSTKPSASLSAKPSASLSVSIRETVGKSLYPGNHRQVFLSIRETIGKSLYPRNRRQVSLSALDNLRLSNKN